MPTNKRERRRYPGPEPFSSEQNDIFFGRDADVATVLELLRLHTHLLIYAKSGIGKSSLLNAGVLPALKKETGIRVEKFSFGLYTETGDSEKTPLNESAGFIQRMIRKESHEKKPPPFYLDKIIFRENSLWYNLKNLQRLLPEDCRILLIFDQFEELFSYPEDEINLFKRLLSEALFRKIPANFHDALMRRPELEKKLTSEELAWLNRPLDFKAAFAIRSDRISQLNQLADALPDIVKNFYEVKPLTREQAETAIVQPAALDKEAGDFKCPAFRYAPDLLAQMLDTLGKTKEQYIETFQIQLLCGQIEEDVIAHPRKVVARNDENINLDNFLLVFYENCLKKLPAAKRDGTRKFIEHALLIRTGSKPNKNGIRRPIFLAEIRRDYPDIDDDTLRTLIGTRLIREEPDAAMNMRFEISHDTLIEPIFSSKDSLEDALGRQEILRQREYSTYEEIRTLKYDIGSKGGRLDWKRLIDDIHHNQAVIIVGDDAIRGPDGKSLPQSIREFCNIQGDRLFDFFYEDEQLFQFRDALSKMDAAFHMTSFYDTIGIQDQPVSHFAHLPISLILSLEQTGILKKIFTQAGRRVEVEALDGRSWSHSGVNPSPSRPFILHILGLAERPDSMALTYEDVFERLQFLLNSRIPDTIKVTLREARSLILVGVDFEKSYMMILLWSLLFHDRSIIYAVRNTDTPPNEKTMSRLERVFGIRFIDISIEEFARRLADEFRYSGGVSQTQDRVTLLNLAMKSLEENETGQAIQILEEYGLDNMGNEDMLLLYQYKNQFSQLERSYLSGTTSIQEAHLKRNQITLGLTRLIEREQNKFP